MKKIILAFVFISVTSLVSGCAGNGCCTTNYSSGCCGSDSYSGNWY